MKARARKLAALRAAGHTVRKVVTAGLHPAIAFSTNYIGLSKSKVHVFHKIASTH